MERFRRQERLGRLVAQTKKVQSPDLIQGLITRRNITIVSSCREELVNINQVDAGIGGDEEDDSARILV